VKTEIKKKLPPMPIDDETYLRLAGGKVFKKNVQAEPVKLPE